MNHQTRSVATISENSTIRVDQVGSGESDSAGFHPGACAAGGRSVAGSARVVPVRARRAVTRDVQRVRRVDRRPLVGRPGGTPVRYESMRVAPRRRPHGPRAGASSRVVLSSSRRVEWARAGFATLALAALAAALFVTAMLLLAQWRAGAQEPAAPARYSSAETPRSVEQVSLLMKW